MSRPTPFDLLFAHHADVLADVTVAAAAAGRDPRDRTDFAAVPDVQRLLSDFESPDVVAAHPEAAAEYLLLLHAAYRFNAAGRRVVTPGPPALERWAGRLPPATAPDVPGGACYLQLPEQRWWVQRAPDAPHEPMDGVFLTLAPRNDEIALLAILGLRAERGGFTQVSVQARPADFAAARTMRRDPPFAPLMEGGTAARFRSIATAAELLTLVQIGLLAAADVEAG
jgi:hypothetical protein